MHLPDLQDLSDRASLYSHLSQRLLGEHLTERLGEYRWEADTQEARLSFVSQEGRGRIDTTMSVIASLAPGPRSMLWGWAHPQATNDLALRLRAYGEEHGIASLTSPEVALPTTASGPELHEEIGLAAHVVGQVAVQVSGSSPYYSAPSGGGTRLVVMLSGHEFPTPRLDERVPLRVSEAFQAGLPISDHRRAFHGLAALAGWSQEWAPDWSQVSISDPVTGNGIEVGFDESSRFSRLSGRLRPRG
ncbi:DUF6882 domain-containing protein [Nocardioides sp. C4-1]|uniref:DUF6882 domain-containing protein n=1 Tax=Nocardioides sp. C4-1 TaxID=3151851 RepID=UPI003266B723